MHSLVRGRLIGGRSMKSITIDYSKRVAEEPGKGHNRWHEAIAPVIEAAPGEEVEIQTRDAFDGQISEGEELSSAPIRCCTCGDRGIEVEICVLGSETKYLTTHVD